ncbi:MAG: response regulator [Rhodospirillaceae bacterium]|jgi:DNA-binding response OmpR family regulator|nr:response regulator [Rhodospirillaceae bacterium]
MADILLIEDDDLLREYLRDGLRDTNHCVREAASGEKGLALFGEAAAELVITDLVMDDGEGVSTILALRESCPETPIIAISGNPLYLDSALKLGANLGLLKPFTMSTMLDAITKALQTSVAKSA